MQKKGSKLRRSLSRIDERRQRLMFTFHHCRGAATALALQQRRACEAVLSAKTDTVGNEKAEEKRRKEVKTLLFLRRYVQREAKDGRRR